MKLWAFFLVLLVPLYAFCYDEDFERSSLSPSTFPWTTWGNASWSIDSSTAVSGSYSVRSGIITHSQSTYLDLTIYITSSGNISFYRKVSSEGNYDFLKFYVDGVLRGSWSGEVPWGSVSYSVTTGTHTFRWVYSKDSSASSGSDMAWIDAITFPPYSVIVWPSISVSAYFPITAGNKWVYTYAYGGYSSYDYVYEAIGSKLFYGRTVKIIRVTNDILSQYGYYGEEYYYEDKGEVYYAGSKSYGYAGSFVEVSHNPPVKYVSSNVYTGASWSTSPETRIKYFDSDGTVLIDSTSTYTIGFQVASMSENITVPAGQFNCIKLSLQSSGGMIILPLNINYYLSSGVGPVKLSYKLSGVEYDYFLLKNHFINTTLGSIGGNVSLLNNVNPSLVKVEVFQQSGAKLTEGVTNLVGDYLIQGIPAGNYRVETSVQGPSGIIYSASQNVLTDTQDVNFKLNAEIQLASVEGGLSYTISSKHSAKTIKYAKPSWIKESTLKTQDIFENQYVEITNSNGKLRVPVDTSGNFKIPNLLPGDYSIKAFNGYAYSKSKTLSLSPGQKVQVDFSDLYETMPEDSVFAFPNPAVKSDVTIRFYCNSLSDAKIYIYTLSGEMIKKVGFGEILKTDAPIYRYVWDTKNSSGQKVASGVYFFQVTINDIAGQNHKVTKKLAIIR